MTYVLTEKYGFSRVGLLAYAKNRSLRILPLYFLALGLGVITIYVLAARGIDSRMINPQFALPRSLYEWAFPLTLLEVFRPINLPVPVANALGIEVCAYFLMPVLARWKSMAWLALVASLALSAYYGIVPESFVVRYATFGTCLAPFAAGAIMVHYRASLQRFRASPPSLALLVWTLHGLAVLVWPSWHLIYGLYVSILLSCWVVISLVNVRVTPLDALSGDLSYPMYLLHSTVAAWFLLVFGFSSSRFFLTSYGVTILVSLALVKLVDKRIKNLKSPPALKVKPTLYPLVTVPSLTPYEAVQSERESEGAALL